MILNTTLPLCFVLSRPRDHERLNWPESSAVSGARAGEQDIMQ